MAAFTKADIPAAMMHSLDDILGDEHLNAIGYFKTTHHPSEGSIREIAIPTEWSASQPVSTRHAPRLGEHTMEVLREAGIDQETMDALLEQRVIVAAKGQTTGEENHV